MDVCQGLEEEEVLANHSLRVAIAWGWWARIACPFLQPPSLKEFLIVQNESEILSFLRMHTIHVNYGVLT